VTVDREPMPRPAAVHARGWGWRHAGREDWAIRGLDLRIEAGERVLLLGPSGAGKSTLLLAMAGLLDPAGGGASEGELLVAGAPAAAVRDRTGIVFQDPTTQLVMSRAGDDVAFGLENRGVPGDEIWARVDEALASVGLPYGRDRRTGALSGGEQQRLAIAGTLALRPGLLLMDEPTANLDPEGAALVRASIAAALEERSSTFVLVEHRLEEALPLVDRVLVLEAGGGLVADGTPGEVFAAQGAALADAGVWVPGAPPPRPPARHRAEPETLVLAEQVGFTYPRGERPALEHVDVQVRSSEAVVVAGPNGSGKSTLAWLLAGLLRPTAGSVLATEALDPGHGHEPIWRWRARALAGRIGMVFQEPRVQFLSSTVRDELALGPRRIGLGEAEAGRRATELLDRLRLGHLAAANPFTLSGGEQRRLSVATALATAPAAIVLDEPTFGQDRRTWAEMLALLAGLRDAGRAICVVTHDRDFAAALADRTLRLAIPTADHLARQVEPRLEAHA
jgi:energy-coupling factor transporter ATP-binding protein EcfA2